MIFDSIKKLIVYGIETGLIEDEDRVYSINRILEALQLDEYEEPKEEYHNIDIEITLKELTDYACENGLCENSVVYRDLFDTKLMGLLTPRPGEVNRTFWGLYNNSSPNKARTATT